ncbi:MAG: hypothetical protein ABSB73_09655 [Solirubrobacteraceae bacterium]|jgi:hypothetical protein
MSEPRDPWTNPTPLDQASFYIESLKYGPAEGKLEPVSGSQVVDQLEALLRDAGVTSMTGAELIDAMEYYARSSGRSFGASLLLMRSVFLDGLMHGIALAAGLHGVPRDPGRVD